MTELTDKGRSSCCATGWSGHLEEHKQVQLPEVIHQTIHPRAIYHHIQGLPCMTNQTSGA